MDSGGSYHITPRRDFFFDFKEFDGGKVLLDDNRVSAIKRTGKVKVQMKDGSSFVLENVHYILELKRKLISLGTLDKGAIPNIKDNYVYSLDGWAESGEASVGIQEKKSLAQEWHKRLDHISEVGLHRLERREGKLKPRAIKCIFIGYPNGVNGYILWRFDDVKPKIIIRRDVVFDESLMYKDTLKGIGVVDSRKEVEFKVELQGSTIEPTMDPHTRENLGNEDDEEPQQWNLDNYVRVHDRVKRTTTIPARYMDEGNVSFSRPSGFRKEDDMVAYAFAIAEEEDTHEPITF
ncbi:hypothetical protein Tco_1368116 [Tanacetum coccineum]